MLRAIWPALLISAVLLAGCSSSDQPRETQPSATGTPTQDADKQPLATPPDAVPSENSSFVPNAVWDTCRGLRIGIPGASSSFTFDPPPPGWESNNPLTEFDLRFYECDKLSWGSFERGPVQMIVELGGNFQNPDACSGENATLLRNMASWWVSDPEVAQYMGTAYGINAYATNFTVDRAEQGGIIDQTWGWGAAGARSHVRLVDADAPASETNHVTRIFWFVDNGTYAMDWSETWLFPTGSTQGSAARPVTGRLEDPMLYSSSSSFNDFTGRADRYEGMQLAANFVRFGDYACEKPF